MVTGVGEESQFKHFRKRERGGGVDVRVMVSEGMKSELYYTLTTVGFVPPPLYVASLRLAYLGPRERTAINLSTWDLSSVPLRLADL